MMEVPSTFEDGFSWTSLFGCLFIAMLMVPGAMYMQLLAGVGVGPAAQWVTVILFIEVARRAHKSLKRAEIFVLFYMAGALTAQTQQFGNLLYNQFFAQSQAAIGAGIIDTLPHWYAPKDPSVLAQRNFFMWEWAPAVGILMFQTILGRFNSSMLSYGLFRVASDMEKLPFPMAPIGAQGILALSEQQSEESGKATDEETAGNWRWRVFSIGGALGLAFGALYLALPTVSSAFLGKPITIFPIPFVDWTDKTSSFLPAVATGLSLNLGQLIVGMVLPFFAMVGSFIGLMITVIANPILYGQWLPELGLDMLPSWNASNPDTIKTLYSNNIDFYFSFTLGVTIIVGIIGVTQLIRGLYGVSKHRKDKERAEIQAGEQVVSITEELDKRKTRGDISPTIIIAGYTATSMAYILLSGYLINWHPTVMIVLVFFAFLYTPLISYVTARLEGMAGQVIAIPMVREAAFILSGYRGGVDIWFLPVPFADYGRATVLWRQAELTGTRFWSIWKAEIFLIPIVLLAAIFFSQLIWGLAPVPGPQYPYAEMIWELNASMSCVVFSSTLGGYSVFEEAFSPKLLGIGMVFGSIVFSFMWIFKIPAMLIYGIIKGVNQTLPHVVLPQFIGALIGRYYFKRKMGLKWQQYIPVVAAGFSCGMGLITVFSIGITFLAKSVINLPF